MSRLAFLHGGYYPPSFEHGRSPEAESEVAKDEADFGESNFVQGILAVLLVKAGSRGPVSAAVPGPIVRVLSQEYDDKSRFGPL